MAAKSQRVKPDETIVVGKARVKNETSNSIQVTVAADGTVRVTDCCLEEQHK